MLELVSAALNMFFRKLRVASEGIRQYPGNATKICKQIVADCWNGTYFQGSAGHFSQFWLRDFAMSAPALAKLGYKKEIKKTLEWALKIYSKNNKITTTIFPGEKPVDVWSYSTESLPYLLRTLRLFAPNLIIKHKTFLSKQIKYYYDFVLNKKTGLVRKDYNFSAMKDAVRRESSCYDNVMLALLAEELKEIKNLPNPFKKYNFKKIIEDNFWTGEYFLDDLSSQKYIASDANVVPFWTGLFSSKKMLKSAIKSIQKSKLDRPFPIKYTSKQIKSKERFIANLFTSNYEGNTIWMQIGPMFIALIKKINKKQARDYINQYKYLIEKHKNYLELFNPNGTVYQTPFYYADEGMIWAAMFLDVMK